MEYCIDRKLTKKEIFKNCLFIMFFGMIAGAIIGLGGWMYLAAGNKVVGALLFPFGLYLICRLDINLYTGKIGFVSKDGPTIPYLAVTLAGNIIGAILLGLCCHWLYGPNMEPTTRGIYELGLVGFTGYLGLFVKAFLCGCLVYLAVLLYKKQTSDIGKFMVVLIPIFIFVLCGFRHCIADMFYMFATFELTWQAFVAFLITVVGNSAGSILLHLVVY